MHGLGLTSKYCFEQQVGLESISMNCLVGPALNEKQTREWTSNNYIYNNMQVCLYVDNMSVEAGKACLNFGTKQQSSLSFSNSTLF